MSVLKYHPDAIRESGFWTSKKFWAYLLGQAGNFTLSLIWLKSQAGKMDSLNLILGLGLLFTGAFMQVSFILGQAYLDKFLMLVREVVPGGSDTPMPEPKDPEAASPEGE